MIQMKCQNHITYLGKLLLMNIFLLISQMLVAQNDNPFPELKVTTSVFPKNDTLVKANRFILPSSVSLYQNGILINPEKYKVVNQYILWTDKLLPENSIDISYRMLSVDLEAPARILDSSKLQVTTNPDDRIIGLQYVPANTNFQEAIGWNELQYNGSLARSISFGNTQDLVLNSNLNLQINGIIGDSILLTAAITDDNIPLQPEGNTQQLREFDQLFIRLEKNEHQLTAGDYELASPESSYFMKYFKELKGMTYQSKFSMNDYEWTTSTSGAISKGKFARNQFMGIEGNQGPYLLQGENGASFVIILAGTERIYIDGELMKRGFQFDYTIDYNSGELTFTPNRLINSEQNITVEFEYVIQEYSRSIIATSNEIKKDKWSLAIHFYNEMDGKNPSNLNDISTEQLQSLSNVGDTTALVRSIQPFDPVENVGSIRYFLKDTIANGLTYTNILVATQMTENAVVAKFSEVGVGNGNYLLLSSAANGRTYQWIAPDPLTGGLNGNFEPVIQLTPPEQRLMTSMKIGRQLKNKNTIFSELSLSKRDLNRFSTIDDNNNIGIAQHFGVRQQTKIKNKVFLVTNLDYEFKQKDFDPLNVYRNTEYNIDYNLSAQTIQAHLSEHLPKAQIGIKNANGEFMYGFDALLKDTLFNGNRHALNIEQSFPWMDLSTKSSFVQTSGLFENTQFLISQNHLSKNLDSLKNTKIGVKYWKETNFYRATGTDTLLRNTYAFDDGELYFNKTLSDIFEIGTSVKRRYNYQSEGNKMKNSSVADQIGINGNWNNPLNEMIWTINYRKVDAQPFSSIQSQESFLGRIENQLTLPKGLLRFNTTYELSGGREQVLEYSYLEVGSGLGNYLWNDFNNNTIRELDEFEIAPEFLSDSARYIRVTSFTREFVPTNNLLLNQTINFDFSKTQLPKLLAKISNTSRFSLNRKTKANSPSLQAWNPLLTNIADSSLIFVNSSFYTNFYFNKGDRKYSIELGTNGTSNRNLLTNGYEQKYGNDIFQNFRWNINKVITYNHQLNLKKDYSDSEFFENKRYEIEGYQIRPNVTFFLKENLRTQLFYGYQSLKDQLSSSESLEQSIKNEWTWNVKSKSSVRLSGDYRNIRFNGAESSAVGFALLKGLKNGENILWSVDYNQFLTKQVVLSIGYEGRKIQDTRPAHLGRMEIKAVF